MTCHRRAWAASALAMLLGWSCSGAVQSGVSAGSREVLGGSVVFARADRLELSLSRAAYVTVVRVWPSGAVQLLYPVTPRQSGGERWQAPRRGVFTLDLSAFLPQMASGERMDPVRVPEHYLVVIASDRPFDPDQVAARLTQLELPHPADEAAARTLPAQLISGAQGEWATWVAKL